MTTTERRLIIQADPWGKVSVQFRDVDGNLKKYWLSSISSIHDIREEAESGEYQFLMGDNRWHTVGLYNQRMQADRYGFGLYEKWIDVRYLYLPYKINFSSVSQPAGHTFATYFGVAVKCSDDILAFMHGGKLVILNADSGEEIEDAPRYSIPNLKECIYLEPIISFDVETYGFLIIKIDGHFNNIVELDIGSVVERYSESILKITLSNGTSKYIGKIYGNNYISDIVEMKMMWNDNMHEIKTLYGPHYVHDLHNFECVFNICNTKIVKYKIGVISVGPQIKPTGSLTKMAAKDC